MSSHSFPPPRRSEPSRSTAFRHAVDEAEREPDDAETADVAPAASTDDQHDEDTSWEETAIFDPEAGDLLGDFGLDDDESAPEPGDFWFDDDRLGGGWDD